MQQIPDPCTPLHGVVISEGTPDFSTVISLFEVKAALRIDETTDDTYLESLIDQAVNHLEKSMDTRLAQRSVVVAYPFLNDEMLLPLNPVNSISGITYLDFNSSTATLDPTIYKLVPTAGQAKLSRRYNKLFPTVLLEDNSVLVTCEVGYTDTTLVPQALRQALIVMVADQYRNPDRPLTAVQNVEWLKGPFRTGGFVA